MKRKNILNLIFIFLLALVSVLPAFSDGYYNLTADTLFHFDRFENISGALNQGQLPELFNFQYTSSQPGVAINAMYPWVMGLIFAVPRLIISDPLWYLGVGFFC